MTGPFTELILEESYFSGLDGGNLVEDFYLPVLEKAISYDRVAGYFSSASLSAAAKGIAGLIKNGGKMRLVTSHAFTLGDVNRLQSVADSKELEQEMLEGFEASVAVLDGLQNAIARDHFLAMCWMLANDKLEIKVVIPKGADLTKLTPTEIEKFHPKFGILSDNFGNQIAFSGSVNETRYAWTRNDENMDVFQSWLPGRTSYINPKQERFNRYWNRAEDKNWYVLDLPEAVRQKIVLDYAPDDLPDSVKSSLPAEPTTYGLSRKYQSDAVASWVKNDYSGILAMATGTGKTRTAAACINEAASNGSLLTIVVVPYRHIGEQWVAELSGRSPIFVSGKWREKLGKLKADASLGRLANLTLVVVKNTAASSDFVSSVSALSQSFDHTLLVGDEVHWLGAPSLQAALLECADYRLGLSATYKRYFDDLGTELLQRYFRDVVFRFPLEKALAASDDNGNRILTPYRYHPVFVNLTDSESEKYWSFTRQILALKAKKKATHEDQKKLEKLFLYRAEIGKNAQNKVPRLKELLEDFELKLKNTLIYCSNFSQMEAVQEVLSKFDVFPQKVTGEESTTPSKYFNMKSERQHILEGFAQGNLDVLLAIDCLDEGVDIPSAQIGIILASSGNEKEFIQRRGRLMRVSPGKDVAEIFDFCVLPSGTQDASGIKNLMRVELARIVEFSENALNGEQVRQLVQTHTGGLLDD